MTGRRARQGDGAICAAHVNIFTIVATRAVIDIKEMMSAAVTRLARLYSVYVYWPYRWPAAAGITFAARVIPEVRRCESA